MKDPTAAFGGINIIISPLLPMPSGHKQDARQIVRHGLADVPAWLGEDVGPKPGEETHMLMFGRDLLASELAAAKLREACIVTGEWL